MEITTICGGHYILYSFRNGTLDLLMADSPILDYYRATDPGCDLQRIGETYVEDAYAIGMTKGYVGKVDQSHRYTSFYVPYTLCSNLSSVCALW